MSAGEPVRVAAAGGAALSLRARRNFRRLWAAGLISLTGDWALLVALPFEVYRRTHSTLATAALVVLQLLPLVVLGPLAGAVIDRHDRRRLAIGADLVHAAGLLPLLAIDRLGSATVFVVVVIQAGAKTVFVPAERALLPEALESTGVGLLRANALVALQSNVARLLGPALGAGLLAAIGLGAVVGVDLASFLVAAVLLSTVVTRARGAAPRNEDRATHCDDGRDLRSARQVIRDDRALTAALHGASLFGFSDGVIAALFAPFVRDVLRGSAGDYAVVVAAQAVGGLLGASCVVALSRRASAVRLLAAGGLGLGLVDLVMFSFPLVERAVLPVVVGMFVAGLPSAAAITGLTTLQQSETAMSLHGRVVAAFAARTAMGTLVGALLAGALAPVLGVTAMLIAAAGGFLSAGAVVHTAVPTRPE